MLAPAGPADAKIQDLTPLRALLAPADRVAIAISGGADSVALAVALGDLAARGRVEIAGLIHVNHGLRGAESDADEAFCRAFAARRGWPIEVGRVSAAALARERRVSIEVASREARYAFFPDAAARLGATVVATAHTLDDQAETVMLRLLRGAGTRGLSGIRPRRGLFVRPLLDTPRATLRAFLVTRGESWREDASNADLTIARNRLRHELMPVLARLAPGGIRAIARLASLAADDEAVLHSLAIETLGSLVLSNAAAGRIELDARRLAAAPAAVARRIVRHLGESLTPPVSLGVRHLEAVLRLAASDRPCGVLDLPGLSARREDRTLVLVSVAGRQSDRRAPPPAFSRELSVPGSVSIPEAGVVITARMGGPEEWAASAAEGAGLSRVCLQAGQVRAPLTVRTRQPGDRMRPLGAPGRRKLQDVFVDRKVPRAARDVVPIVEDAEGRLLWAAGVAMSEEARVTAPEAGMVILEMRKVQ